MSAGPCRCGTPLPSGRSLSCYACQGKAKAERLKARPRNKIYDAAAKRDYDQRRNALRRKKRVEDKLLAEQRFSSMCRSMGL